MNFPAVRRFFNAVFGGVSTEIRCIHPRTHQVKSYWGSLETLDFKNIARVNDAGYGVFAVINATDILSLNGHAVRDKDITHINALFVEIDTPGDNLSRLQQAELHPSKLCSRLQVIGYMPTGWRRIYQ